MREAAAILIGYLIGSILPAYILGRLIKGIDIRQHGTGNAGTVNTAKVLGLLPAVPTAIYDTLKGVGAVYISLKLLRVSEPVAYASGIAAIAGHVFPFYLGFRGGQGVATAVGLMLRNLFLLYSDLQKLRASYFDWLVLLAAVLAFWYISKRGTVVGVVVLPVLIYQVILRNGVNPLTIFTGLLIAHILFVDIVLNIIKERIFALKPEARRSLKLWRFALRPFAVLFLVFYELIGKPFAITLLGGVTLAFLLFDLVRLSHSRLNLLLFRNLMMVFKEKEARRFSSMTLFLIASSITLLLFERSIAFLVMLFLIFGDMFAKFFGLRFGRRRFFHKTVEGSLAHLICCLIVGSLVKGRLRLSPAEVVLGSAVATLAEAAPTGIDDNLSVGLITSIVLKAFRFGASLLD
ncbi:hypothetical protein DRP77_02300 [Candidatus Poribacteria bacterium]|nr:MAG: hypothetical protein DRP77_02300 [Candidatus Poribacteria bacterium]